MRRHLVLPTLVLVSLASPAFAGYVYEYTSPAFPGFFAYTIHWEFETANLLTSTTTLPASSLLIADTTDPGPITSIELLDPLTHNSGEFSGNEVFTNFANGDGLVDVTWNAAFSGPGIYCNGHGDCAHQSMLTITQTTPEPSFGIVVFLAVVVIALRSRPQWWLRPRSRCHVISK